MASSKEASPIKWFVVDQLGDNFRLADSILLTSAPDIQRMLKGVPYERLLITKNQGLKFAVRGEAIVEVDKLLGSVDKNLLGGSARLRAANTPISAEAIKREDEDKRSVIFKGICRQMSAESFVKAIKTVAPDAISGQWLSPSSLQSGVMKITMQTHEATEAILKTKVKLSGICIPCEKFTSFKKPTQCFNCWKFGHIGAVCKESVVCKKCAEGHNYRECAIKGHAAEGKCTNCKGKHSATFPGCPAYSAELEKMSPKLQKQVFQPAKQPTVNPWANKELTTRSPVADEIIAEITREVCKQLIDLLKDPSISLSDFEQAVNETRKAEGIDLGILNAIVPQIRTAKTIAENLAKIRSACKRSTPFGRTDDNVSPTTQPPGTKSRKNSIIAVSSADSSDSSETPEDTPTLNRNDKPDNKVYVDAVELHDVE